MKFPAYPKTPRFNMGCIVTEKIDGTNALISIQPAPEGVTPLEGHIGIFQVNGIEYNIGAGSRKRWLTHDQDNFGFGRWVRENARELIELLGEGLHYGEWWGKGIQRGYAQNGKRFSLFDGPGRYPWAINEAEERQAVDVDDVKVSVVPLIYQGSLELVLEHLNDAEDYFMPHGSHAQKGYMKTEGLIVSLRGSGGGQRFKIVWRK
jgi:hypothetical protein